MKKLNRRSFFQMALGSLAVAPILLNIKNAQGASCTNTPPAGKKVAQVGVGMAKGLDYVDNASNSKNAKFKAGQDCTNCKFYQTAKAEKGYAPCTMMGMSFVAGCGWCKSYLKK